MKRFFDIVRTMQVRVLPQSQLNLIDMDEKYLEGLCGWLKEHKGITKIELEKLAEFVPEYEAYLKESTSNALAYRRGRSKQLNDTQEFSNAYGLPVASAPVFNKESIYKQHMLILEEVEELEDAASEGSMAGVLDAIEDIMYLCPNLLNSTGLWQVHHEAWDEVHRSNMSKLGADGKPIYREDGKVMKGPNYSPPQLQGIVDRVYDGPERSIDLED